MRRLITSPLFLLGVAGLSLFAVCCWAKGEIDDLCDTLDGLWQDDPRLVEAVRRL